MLEQERYKKAYPRIIICPGTLCSLSLGDNSQAGAGLQMLSSLWWECHKELKTRDCSGLIYSFSSSLSFILILNQRSFALQKTHCPPSSSAPWVHLKTKGSWHREVYFKQLSFTYACHWVIVTPTTAPLWKKKSHRRKFKKTLYKLCKTQRLHFTYRTPWVSEPANLYDRFIPAAFSGMGLQGHKSQDFTVV